MSEFIPDIEAARLIQNLGITSDETSEDGLTKTSTLGNGETLIQHLGPTQWEYSGTLESEPTDAPALAQAETEPVAPAVATDAQTAAQPAESAPAPAADAPPLDPAAPAAS